MSEEIQIELLDEKLSPQNCLDFVSNDEAGGIAAFVGTVRNNTKGRKVRHLDFEAYAPMAIKEMQKIAETVKEKWKALKVVIHHRVGHLEIGDIAVVIVVATPHRKAAFEACEYAIDTLKQTVPIWKKEYFEDGEVWVAAHP